MLKRFAFYLPVDSVIPERKMDGKKEEKKEEIDLEDREVYDYEWQERL